MKAYSLALLLVISTFNFAAATTDLSYNTNVDDLFNELKKLNAQTLLDAVNVLDKQFFKRENYVLIFDSMSPQGSRAEAPRVVLFGKDKKLRIGFSPHNQDGKNFEIIQWRKITKTWEFREISFSKNGPKMSPADPSVCLQCHRDHKPKIVDSYLNELTSSLKGKVDTTKFVKIKAQDPIYKKLDGWGNI